MSAPTRDKAAMAWVVGRDTGISSEAIWAVMMGVEPSDRRRPFGNYPHDPADFGRCYRLLKLMPEWRARIGEMAKEGEVWARLAEAWDELTALYEEEAGDKIDVGYGWSAPRLYARMKEMGA